MSMIMIQSSNRDKISVFGSTGFIGGSFCNMFREACVPIDRESREPRTKSVLYFISTTDNFNIFEDPQKDIDTNLKVLVETLQNCKDSNITFNFISSWYVYGDVDLPAREDSECSPRGFYSITKKCAEDLLISFCKTFNIKYRILRLGNVYGRSDTNASKKKNALQFLTERLINDEPIHLYDGGSFTRDYIHVNDACRAINKIIHDGQINAVYNVGSGVEYTFSDLIDIVKKHVGSTSIIESKPTPNTYAYSQVNNMCLDTSMLSELGFKCSIAIDDGIIDMCNKLKAGLND